MEQTRLCSSHHKPSPGFVNYRLNEIMNTHIGTEGILMPLFNWVVYGTVFCRIKGYMGVFRDTWKHQREL